MKVPCITPKKDPLILAALRLALGAEGDEEGPDTLEGGEWGEEREGSGRKEGGRGKEPSGAAAGVEPEIPGGEALSRRAALALKSRLVGKVVTHLRQARAGGDGGGAGGGGGEGGGGEGMADEMVSLPMPAGAVTVDVTVTGSYVALVTGRACPRTDLEEEDEHGLEDAAAEEHRRGDVGAGRRDRGWREFRYTRQVCQRKPKSPSNEPNISPKRDY